MMPNRTRVKICCIADVTEARVAIDAGADVLGLVSAMPSGPGPIDETIIAAIARFAPPGVATVLLTALTDADALIEQHRRCQTNAIQLVDTVDAETFHTLRGALPAVKLIQVIHVRSAQSVADAVTAAKHADAILLDSGNPALAIKQLGGTGRVHDWEISRQIVHAVSVPVYLAGGLNAQNIAEAIARVRPFGVDLCSSLRTDGRLDASKTALFMHALDATPEAA